MMNVRYCLLQSQFIQLYNQCLQLLLHYADEFENAALFLRLSLPSTLIHRKPTELFENTFQTAGMWKRRLLISVWKKTFSQRSFSNTMASQWSWPWFPWPSVFFFTNRKWAVIGGFSSFFSVVRSENNWCFFRVQRPFSNSYDIMWTEF